jgi:hypothetical protein
MLFALLFGAAQQRLTKKMGDITATHFYLKPPD